MSDVPPKRFESELTVVIDRDLLPPKPSTIPGPTIDMLAEIARAKRDLEDDVDTMVPCAACEHCRECGGLHMTSPQRAAKYRSEHPEPPPPPSRPEAA